MRQLRCARFPDQADPEDDVDRLLHRLAPLEPPADLVVRLRDALAHIAARPSAPACSWDEQCQGDGLLVRNEKQEPS